MDINTFFQSLKGETIYYKPNPGNGGDALIAFAAFSLLKKNGVNYRIYNNNDLTGKIALYAGGGNLVDEYKDCANFVKDNFEKAKQIIILPHTVSGHKNLLSLLNDKVTIICREKESYNYVKSFSNIKNTLLIDDLVFNINFLQDFPLYKKSRLLQVAKPRHILSNIYRRKYPISFYTKKRNSSSTLNAFRVDAEKTSINIPEDNIDVSAVINFDSSMSNEKLVEKTVINIVSFLNQYSIINTNRLHICITGALLGKNVRFYANSYWKNRSVYEHSIKNNFPNVEWIEN